MKCWHPLDLPAIGYFFNTKIHMLEVDIKDCLRRDRATQELNEMFPIKRASILCSEKFEVHSDGFYENGVRKPARCGVNFILCGEGALRWYDPGVMIEDRKGTYIYSGYKKEIDCWDHFVGEWALVRTDVPHSPMAYAGHRAIISFRNKDLSFEEAEELLKPVIY